MRRLPSAILLAAIATATLFAPSVFAAEPPLPADRAALYAALDQAAKTGGASAVKAYIWKNTGNNMRTLRGEMMWLDNQTMLRPQPLYNLYIAELAIRQAQDLVKQNKAAVAENGLIASLTSLLGFKIIGLIDAARCKDPSVADAVIRAFDHHIANFHLDQATNAQSPFQKSVVQSILEEEDGFATRPPNTDLCSIGLRNGSDGFVTNDAWQNKRQALRKQFLAGQF